MNRAVWGTVVMTVLLLIYIAVTLQLALRLIGTGDTIAIAMGVALVIIPVVGIWALAREILFGIQSQRLIRILENEGTLEMNVLPQLPSGRPRRDAADADFAHYAAEAEAKPDDWRAQLRLGLAYDASRDRRRARASVREAIRLERVTRRPA